MSKSTRPMIIDGLIVGRIEASLFREMHDAGLVAANLTCSVWEGFEDTMRNIAMLKRLIQENSDIVLEVRSAKDILRAQEEGKVGIIMGWQNSTGFGEYLPFVPLMKELGLRVVQLTYSTANSAASGCYERNDGGVTEYGRDLIAAMNEARILIDLSHVGNQSARETVAISAQPVAYTHCCPFGMFPHPRNKSDEDLRAIAEKGGFVGVAAIPTFLPGGSDAGIEAYIDAIVYVANVVGEGNVGIGTDISQGQPAQWYDWIASDKGYGRSFVKWGGIPLLKGLESVGGYPNLVAAMERRIKPDLMERVLGLNWLRFMDEVWG